MIYWLFHKLSNVWIELLLLNHLLRLSEITLLMIIVEKLNVKIIEFWFDWFTLLSLAEEYFFILIDSPCLCIITWVFWTYFTSKIIDGLYCWTQQLTFCFKWDLFIAYELLLSSKWFINKLLNNILVFAKFELFR